MSDPLPNEAGEAPLNPALKSTSETVYDTTHSTPPPVDTASAKGDEGAAWPWIWLVVAVFGVALAIWFLI